MKVVSKTTRGPSTGYTLLSLLSLLLALHVHPTLQQQNEGSRDKCRTVQLDSDMCGSIRVRACVPHDADPQNVADLFGFETDQNACNSVQGFHCRITSQFNPNFCSGNDPGFCASFRYTVMRDACITDDDCDGFTAPQVRPPCCRDWRDMQPCKVSDDEYTAAMESGLCVNSTTVRCAEVRKAGFLTSIIRFIQNLFH